ncbi:amino acid adenylation domain-containing protein [Kutzneria buriramensis]|uniref:Nonribosomal peptide synthetase DhbF n=1 Tax=Kutzneria buriramensis TaxID=1045776 RepID=A0A3E0GZ53_9PSEU|nr:amino acid adenylation domain-containing protein [Kutzneria buriramensis]REH34936.1 nonribosomal peptide synthetase DhbF [Kutzneria buriramensis]
MADLGVLGRQTVTEREPATLVKALEEQADSVPAEVALEFDGEELSYRQVHERANKLARHLVTYGVGPDRLVAVMLPRSADLLVTLLAVLKAGGAYLPLDAEHPAERTAFMLAEAQPVVLVTAAKTAASGAELGIPTIVLDAPETAETLSVYPVGHLDDGERNGTPLRESLAYVIYTSGSTGTPKGVEIPLRAMHNLLLAMQDRLSLGPGDRMLSVTTATFDMSVPELFLPFFTGARAVVAPMGTGQDPQQLANLIEQRAVSTAQATPTHWHMLATVSPDVVRGLRVLVGGEALSDKLAATLLGLGAEVIQWYGPTETTVWSTAHTVTRAEDAAVIGTALRNTRLHVLDANLAPVSVGVEGELFISGDGVARGYLNRPELTEERFLPDAFGSPDAKMYRTGDIVRVRADGTLEYVGRSDNQVKLHGFRVELGEVEATIELSENVARAVAAVREDRPGDRRLVAYVTAAPGREPNAHGILEFVAEKLPLYMVPTAVVVLPELPLTPNGKLDRRALPAPVLENAAMIHNHLTESELLLTCLFAEVLGVPQVGPHDSFFDLGGSSVLAARLIKLVRTAMDVDLPIRLLVEHPTVAALSRQLTGEEPQDSFDVLLPLIVRGDRRPLFCMRHLAGTAWSYGVLAQHFGPDYPIYGLQSHTFQELDTPLTSISAIAADYVRLIRGVQPEGPYRVLGWSFGGILAHAVAVELQEQGQEIEFLGVFNTNPLISVKEDRGEQELMALILMIHGVNPADYDRPLTYDDIAEFADMATNYAWQGRRSAAETFVDTMLTDLTAWKDHKPGTLRGALHLFVAEPNPVADSASAREWSPYVVGEIIEHELACTHDELLSNPRVLKEIVAVVTDNLDD